MKEMEFITKTQHYLKVKKPLLERQRRARVKKCLDALKALVAEFQADDNILRMDKAEMLESTITFMRTQNSRKVRSTHTAIESFRFGYMNAVNEVSRVMAATPGMNVEMGKAVMTRLGCEFNRMLQESTPNNQAQLKPLKMETACRMSSMSSASSGYHSGSDDSNSMGSPVNKCVWRPW